MKEIKFYRIHVKMLFRLTLQKTQMEKRRKESNLHNSCSSAEGYIVPAYHGNWYVGDVGKCFIDFTICSGESLLDQYELYGCRV